MSKSWDINDKRFIQIGLKIAYYRKLNEMTQDQLAERIYSMFRLTSFWNLIRTNQKNSSITISFYKKL
ncbi:hypothetical protein [Desulfitobacterium hafniense]|uniref:hypothetical protein n=1 Tax=Desulfitobacterium hafniense TaxID=49338 RepID=UPI0003735BF3|nr:hypothetical protein [Desulfitobacterium hafniense]